MRWMSLLGLLLATSLLADELETIDGAKVTGKLTGISATGDVTGEGIPPDTKFDSLRSIVRDVKAVQARPKYILETHGDGRLLIDSIALANDRFTVALSGGKEMVLPLDAVRCVRLEPDLAMASFKEALAHPVADRDRIFIKVEKQIDVVKGLILSLDDAELTVQFDKETRKIPRERLHGIVLAQAGDPKSQPATVQLANGSRVAGKVASLADGELQLELQGGAKALLSLESVERIDLRSTRVAYLSDLEPESVKEETIFTLARPWQRDRSVTGKTLTLGTRTFARGIGVHAKSELTFDVPEGFDLFVATVGIDAGAMGKGDCDFELLDGNRSLWQQRIKGSEAPQAVRVELKGVKRLTLLVNPGADFDLGDHADWCDARFLKSK
jgi:hypothetical protein